RVADPPKAGARLAARRLRLERDVELLPLLTRGDIVGRDIALVLEDARDLHTDPRRGKGNPRVPGTVRVADPCQHVGDAIGGHLRSSPVRLLDARLLPLRGQRPTADAADPNLAQVRPRSPAGVAACRLRH